MSQRFQLPLNHLEPSLLIRIILQPIHLGQNANCPLPLRIRLSSQLCRLLVLYVISSVSWGGDWDIPVMVTTKRIKQSLLI